MFSVVEKGARLRVGILVCLVAAAAVGCDSTPRKAAAGPAGGEGATGTKDLPDLQPTATVAPSAADRGLDSNGTWGGGVGGGLMGTRAKAGTAGHGAPQSNFGTIGVLPPEDPAPAQPWVPAPPTHLDPNARYATTYRPGGAALAAFDAAVARGQIPASYKDLVGDFGARYAPALARPTDGALAVAVDAERTAVGPQGGALNLRVALVSSEAAAPRAPLSVHIVLDTSGSMSGQAIEDAKSAAEAVVAKLAPTDDFSMVTFSDQAHLLVGDGPVGPRRASTLARIHDVKADGGTNISAGLDMGYAQAHVAGIPQDAVRLVMLLSDGHANGGDTDPDHLAQRAATAFQDGVQTSSFGLGTDFDAALMSRIADRGAGGYYYLADSSQIAPSLAREIDARLQPVATALELRVRLRPDVAATKVFGSRELSTPEAAAVRAQEVAIDQREKKHGIAGDRDQDAAGGMRFFIPAFAGSDRHATMITLQVPPGEGERSIASVELRYKDRLLAKNVTKELPVKIRYAATDAESAATENASVERMVQAFRAGDTILDAADKVDHGDRPDARAELDERAKVLAQASDTLKEPMLAEDGARLVRLASAVGGDQAIHDPLPLVVMLRGTAYGYM